MTTFPPIGEGVAAGVERARERAEQVRMNPRVSFDVAADITYEIVGEAAAAAHDAGSPISEDQQSLFAEVVTLVALAGLDGDQIRDVISHVCPPPFY